MRLLQLFCLFDQTHKNKVSHWLMVLATFLGVLKGWGVKSLRGLWEDLQMVCLCGVAGRPCTCTLPVERIWLAFNVTKISFMYI